MGWQPEDLTSQVDGIATVFSTTFSRDPGRTVLFLDGEQLPPSQFTEPNDTQIQTAFLPAPPQTLYAVYHTDQTSDGRVVGYPDDPTGLGPTSPQGLVDLLDSLDGRIDALEALIAAAPVLPPLTGVQFAELLENPVGTASWLKRPWRTTGVVSPTAGQTVFALPVAPTDPDSVVFLVNGAPQLTTEFSVAGSTVTWLDVPFTLSTTDEVEIRYV